jgi:hypothetical protein
VPIAPGAMPEHDHAIALGDVILRHVFDHLLVALETGKILRQLVAGLISRQIGRAVAALASEPNLILSAKIAVQ